MMPSVVSNREKSGPEWQALKRYILRDRQRKKQEQEADAEVQRQRREREQKQKQDVMTLGETKDQIAQLETRLAALNEEKHQLFLNLKKVLNEDDYRKRQAVKDSASASDLICVSNYQPSSVPVFLQPLHNRTSLYKVGATQNSNAVTSQGSKRHETPSPPAGPVPPGYHPYNNYKSTTSFQHNPPEDGRRNNEYVRAVLWNKGTAAAPYGGVYGIPPSSPVYSYTGSPSAPYEQVYIHRQKPETEKLYLRGPPGPLPMPVHPPQHAKTASISSGFPVRASHSVYLTQGANNSGRVLYSTAPTGVPTARYQGSGAM